MVFEIARLDELHMVAQMMVHGQMGKKQVAFILVDPSTVVLCRRRVLFATGCPCVAVTDLRYKDNTAMKHQRLYEATEVWGVMKKAMCDVAAERAAQHDSVVVRDAAEELNSLIERVTLLEEKTANRIEQLNGMEKAAATQHCTCGDARH